MGTLIRLPLKDLDNTKAVQAYHGLSIFRLTEIRRDLVKIAKDIRLTKAKLRLRMISNEASAEEDNKKK